MGKSVEFTRPSHFSGALSAPLHALAKWFERQKRVLPWRDDVNLYRVWISEIMLQQTQVTTVVPYFERFMATFPRVEDLAAAGEDEVMRLWGGLGYYSRARNLHRAAQEIVKSGFPRTREDWLSIPGVGNYTAGAILSIALDQPEPILDGNVERVLSRVRRVSRRGGDAEFKRRLWSLSRIFVECAHRSGIRPSVVNQALMELGATVCSVRNPRCETCPLNGICRASQQGDAEAYPPRRERKPWVEMNEKLFCLIDGKNRVLLSRRVGGQWRAGLWDLLLELPQEFPKSRAKAVRLGEVETRHVVTRHKIVRVTEVWKLPKFSERESLRAAEPAFLTSRWVGIENPEVAVGSALRKTLERIREKFPEALRSS